MSAMPRSIYVTKTLGVDYKCLMSVHQSIRLTLYFGTPAFFWSEMILGVSMPLLEHQEYGLPRCCTEEEIKSPTQIMMGKDERP